MSTKIYFDTVYGIWTTTYYRVTCNVHVIVTTVSTFSSLGVIQGGKGGYPSLAPIPPPLSSY